MVVGLGRRRDMKFHSTNVESYVSACGKHGKILYMAINRQLWRSKEG